MYDLKFFFSVNDPKFTSKSTVVDYSNTNYISHVFVRCPIYSSSSKKQIGYKVSDDYIQQVAENTYIVRLNNTYTFYNKKKEPVGSISWQYVFTNTKPEIYYPIDVLASSTIISGTGIFKKATGVVNLLPKGDGRRLVVIKFT
jgi:hypothetical protein